MYLPMGDSGCARTAPSVDGMSMECIDANGNVLSSVPITASNPNPSVSAPGSGGTFLGLSTDQLMIAGLAIGAVILFSGKKKGRR